MLTDRVSMMPRPRPMKNSPGAKYQAPGLPLTMATSKRTPAIGRCQCATTPLVCPSPGSVMTEPAVASAAHGATGHDRVSFHI